MRRVQNGWEPGTGAVPVLHAASWRQAERAPRKVSRPPGPGGQTVMPRPAGPPREAGVLGCVKPVNSTWPGHSGFGFTKGEMLRQVTSPGHLTHTCQEARNADGPGGLPEMGGGQEIYGKPARVTKEMTSCTARGGHPCEEQRRGTQGDPSIPEPSVNTRQKAQSRGGICGRRGALGRVEEPQAPGESGSPAFFPWEEVIHHPD